TLRCLENLAGMIWNHFCAPIQAGVFEVFIEDVIDAHATTFRGLSDAPSTIIIHYENGLQTHNNSCGSNTSSPRGYCWRRFLSKRRPGQPTYSLCTGAYLDPQHGGHRPHRAAGNNTACG